MTEERDGDELREGFRELRVDTERVGGVPDFHGMIARAKVEASARPASLDLDARRLAAGRPARIAAWVSVASAAAAVGLLFFGPARTDGDVEFESLVAAFASNSASGAWRSPTSAFLDLPGLDLATVPSIGASMRGVDLGAAPPSAGSEGRDS